ncbi:MAG: hypothetical protein ACE5KK_03540 [Candidatus Brocadiales bacterium]
MKLGIVLGCLLGILAMGIVSTDYCSTALAQESIKAVCPTCKEKTVLRKGIGITPLQEAMVCPDCKGKVAQHVCDKCGTEVIACPACKKVMAAVEREAVEAVCPTCGEKTRLRKGMGITALEKEMVCPDCKGLAAAHVCDKCGAEVAACPRCSKVLAARAEVVKAVCPHCKVERTLRKGMGNIAIQKAMKCPNCEKPVEGFEAHVCGECGVHMVVCPNCRKTL